MSLLLIQLDTPLVYRAQAFRHSDKRSPCWTPSLLRLRYSPDIDLQGFLQWLVLAGWFDTHGLNRTSTHHSPI